MTIHPDAAAYAARTPEPEEGVQRTADQLYARLLASDPTDAVNRLRLLLLSAHQGDQCLLLNHASLTERLHLLERRYSELLAALIATAATEPAVARDVLHTHTATHPAPDLMGTVQATADPYHDPPRPPLGDPARMTPGT